MSSHESTPSGAGSSESPAASTDSNGSFAASAGGLSGGARSAARSVGAAVGGFGGGIGLVLEAFGILRRERRLWPLASVPLVFSALALGATLALVFGNAEWLHALVSGWLPVLQADAWYAWLWVGPWIALSFALGWLLFALATGLFVLAGFLVASLLSSPFLDVLSQRVEAMAQTETMDAPGSGIGAALAELGRSVKNELGRLVFFGSVWVVLAGIGVLVPGAQLVTGPLLMAFMLVFLPLEYAGYSLDRRSVPFAVRRRWVLSSLPVMLGFGGAAFAACFLPGLNLLMMPVLVIAGTRLVLKRPPPA